MAGPSKIEWTDATWNPVRGCTRVSHGCGGPGKQGGCYAEKIAARFSGTGQPFHGFAERRNGEARWTGKLALIDHMLTVPMRWKKSRRIFVNSMSDLFHENLPDEAIDKVFAVMALCPQHTFQVLTKRAERMRQYVSALQTQKGEQGLCDALCRIDNKTALIPIISQPLPNVWLGVSCEDQDHADERIPHLLATPAAVRFVSAEPLLGPLIVSYLKWARIDWLIVGGESGPNARPMHPDWVRSLRNQCDAIGLPFFFKQWGAWRFFDLPDCDEAILAPTIKIDGKSYPFRQIDGGMMVRLGKKRAGCLLDGKEHNEFPDTAAPGSPVASVPRNAEFVIP